MLNLLYRKKLKTHTNIVLLSQPRFSELLSRFRYDFYINFNSINYGESNFIIISFYAANGTRFNYCTIRLS